MIAVVTKYETVGHPHYPVTACLLPICSLNNMAVTTTEGIGNSARLHPVQERIAKAHGSQCGFCTPGMVMSMYALLRNYPEPTTSQIMDALSGNICRCTGYRPILDGCKTFSKASISYLNVKCRKAQKSNFPLLFNEKEFLPLDKTQELIFPPDLQVSESWMKVFQGERVTWYSPSTLKELLELRTKYPEAPLVMGNTNIGLQTNLHGVFHPVMISPINVHDLYTVAPDDAGITIGSAVTLAQLKTILSESVHKLPKHKTKTFQALIQQLRTLAGEQIRSMATLGGHIASKLAISDLNPVLAAAGAQLNLISKGKYSDLYKRKQPMCLIQVCRNISTTKKCEEFVSAFRQAQRERNAYAIVNAGMRVRFGEGTDMIQDMDIFYGGIGSTTLSAKNTSQALIGRHWNEEMLQEACRLALEEISITPSAPGGMVEYKRTMTISFFFKFFLQVLQNRNKTVSKPLVIYLSSIKDFDTEIPKTLQIFQEIDTKQPARDPVGRPIVHLSGIKQATGEAVYVDDMPPVDQELFIAFATSTRAHAKILSIDETEARQVPGVVDIIRAKDVPGKNAVDGQGTLFSEETVECVGQIICAVVADTSDHARRAATKIKIAYEDIEPAIITIEDAIKYKSFYEPFKGIKHGNAEEAFKTADHILEGEVHICGQEQFYMETNSLIVIPKGEENEFDIYVSTQDISTSQFAVAAVLGVPSNRIMSRVKRVGGAFGGKVTKPAIFASAAAVAAQKTKRPIRCVLERGEDMLITAGRHPVSGKYKVGCMNDGKIVAADVSFYTNAGCTIDESFLVLVVALVKMDSAYNFPNLNCRAIACKTNLPSNTAFRGFGFPQTVITLCMPEHMTQQNNK
uniref:FAD-binding PCMH-type domain-containing protein n=1 Tax=Leptobrachium leishanense TaxID=445787 RepID=A0A8C5QI35_9ANUR